LPNSNKLEVPIYCPAIQLFIPALLHHFARPLTLYRVDGFYYDNIPIIF
jgi:hypothetical protein